MLEAIEELNEQELLSRVQAAAEPFAIFLYTPFCGTCKLTARMLEVVFELGLKLPFVQSNVNFLPKLSNSWQVTSVPCILIAANGDIRNRLYRMQSVDYLCRWLKVNEQ